MKQTKRFPCPPGSIFNGMVLNSVRNADRAEGKQDAPVWRQGKACAMRAVSFLSFSPSHSASSVSRQAMSTAVRLEL